jgi:hypothetical protein
MVKLAAMGFELKRITTAYDLHQDRICLLGATADGPTVVIWLTQRLLVRLITVLLEWLDKHVAGKAGPMASHALQSFAQEAAAAALPIEPPVAQEGKEPAWLVKAVDISGVASQTILDLRGHAGERARLAMNPTELRQWLTILHRTWAASGWPTAVWPDWLDSKDAPGDKDIVLH